MIKNAILVGILLCFWCIPLMAQKDQPIIVHKDIQLIHLQDSIYVHVTYHEQEPYGRFASNGMIIIKNGQALMIDTPMDNAKTQKLTQYLEKAFSAKVVKLIIGHYHDDCLGGLGYLQSLGVESIASKLTVDKCTELGLPVPSTPFNKSYNFDFNGLQLKCEFFGAGHSFDNITVWLPQYQILFGGCLIKSSASKGLGNLSDAVVADWDFTVKKIIKAYQNIKTIVPGHGAIGGKELLTHTVKLVETEKNK